MADEVLRLRATIVTDEALAKARQLAREIGLVQSKGGAGAQQAAAGWAKLGNTIKMVGGETLGAATGLAGLSAAGLGTAAGFGIVAAAGYKLASGLGELSSRIIKLNNDSKELGVSTQALRAFATEAQKAGIAPEAMLEGLGNFKRNTEDFSMRIGQLRGQLVQMGAGPVLARINAATNQIDKLKEAYDFKEVLMESDPSGMKARRFFEMIGLGADAARLSWDEFSETMRTKKALSPEDIQAAKDYQKSLIALGDSWDALATKVGIKLFPLISEDLKTLTDIVGALESVSGWLTKITGKGGPGSVGKAIERNTMWFDPFGLKAKHAQEEKEAQEAEERKKKKTAPGATAPAGAPAGASVPQAPARVSAFTAGPGGVSVPTAPSAPAVSVPQAPARVSAFTAPPAGQPIQVPQAMSGGGNESGASRIIQVGVFNALVEFKSYIETDALAGGGGGGVGGVLGGRGGGGGGGARTGGGGAPSGATTPSGGGGGTPAAPGGTGATTGPTTGGGSGDAGGQNTPGSGGQQADRPGPGGQPAQGGQPSGAAAPGGAPAGSSVIPGRFADDVAAMTAAGAKPKNIQDYLKANGVNTDIATCGQFMAQQVKAHGGEPPKKNPAVASNWNEWGQAGYNADPNAINVAVKQGTKPGETGSHVTAAIPVKDKNGNVIGYRGVGVNQGKGGVQGKGEYGRDVVSSIPLKIGTGRGQYQIRSMVPPAGSQVPAGAQPQGATTAPGAPDGSSIPRPGAGADNIGGNTEVDKAVRETAGTAGMDAAHWKAIADLESGLDPSSNKNKKTQYKGLFQIGTEEFATKGQGDRYNAADNARAAAKIAGENNAWFKQKYGRDPQPHETYMMHQQGRGFYSKGTMTNIAGNMPPSLKGRDPKTVTREEFEQGWKERIERGATKFATKGGTQTAAPAGAQAPAGQPSGATPAESAQAKDTSRIDQAVAPPPASGSVNVTVNSNGTKASANSSAKGDLFQPPKITQHKQMQPTETAGETVSI